MAYDFRKHYGPVRFDAYLRSRTVDISSGDFEDENGFVAVSPGAGALTFTLLGDSTETTATQGATGLVRFNGEVVLLKSLKENSSHSSVTILYPTM